MKKIMLAIAIAMIAIVSNAASFKWSGANVYGPDGQKLASATASLFCDALSSSALSTAAVTSGAIAATTFDVDATVGQSYSFYFVIETDGKKFTSAAKTAVAPETGAAGVAFGNLQTATTTAGAWQSVPEPTTGLLILLGMAGLALKRKVA